jgi:hypothetical protein
MGTFAETAIVDYTISFADQGKKNICFQFPSAANKWKFAISVFLLLKTNGSCHFLLFPFSVCGIPETWRHGHGDMEAWRWRHGNMET